MKLFATGRWAGPMLALAVALAVAARDANATTHLVSPGQAWPAATKNLRPGDEILLLPGEHRPALLQSIHGEEGKPIIIRSADPKTPSVITGGHVALQLSDCRHIVVRNVVISDSTLCGVLLDDRTGDLVDELSGAALEVNAVGEDCGTEGTVATPAVPDVAGVRIHSDARNCIALDGVTVRRIGPRGARHGASIVRQEAIRIVNCTFEGWGGAAVEIVASKDVLVQQCSLTGIAKYSQFDGIQVRGGSEEVRIEANSFTNAGVHAVRIGGQSKLTEFKPALEETGEINTAFESCRVVVMHNVIVGSDCAVALSHARRCQVRNNTIVEPRQMVFAAAREHEDTRFGDLDSCLVLGNLITWKSGGSLSGLFLATTPLVRNQVAMDVNLWWTDDCNERHGKLTQFAIEGHAEQLWEIDPLLDEQYRPRMDDAQLYGVPLDGDVQPRVRVASEGS